MFDWFVECFILQNVLNMLGTWWARRQISLHGDNTVALCCCSELSVSRDLAPWRRLSGAKGAYTPYCGWIVAVSKHSQCVVFVCHWYLHLPCPPSLSSLPPGIQTRELDPMFVNLNTETRNRHCLSLLSFSSQFPRSHDHQSSLYVVDSGQCSANKVTSMTILSYAYVVVTAEVDPVTDFLLTVSQARYVCLLFLVSVRRLLPCFAKGGKLSFLAQVIFNGCFS